jgi:hypothetical protein
MFIAILSCVIYREVIHSVKNAADMSLGCVGVRVPLPSNICHGHSLSAVGLYSVRNVGRKLKNDFSLS